MGWTSYHAKYYKNGKVDRKAECDNCFLENGEYNVLKSTMVGSVYYAAVQQAKKIVGTDEHGKYIYADVEKAPVFAAVFLTSTGCGGYGNFAYKDMDETMGPCYYDCPESILKLLSPTENEWALEWREKCREKHLEKAERRKNPMALSNLPIGTRISFHYEGKLITLIKHPPAYQLKRPFWYNSETNRYMPANRIPQDYQIVES